MHAMRLESLPRKREKYLGHHEELRLHPKEHSDWKNVSKQAKIGGPLTGRESCIVVDALSWESGHLVLAPHWPEASCVISLLPTFLICDKGMNVRLTSPRGEHWRTLTLPGRVKNSGHLRNKAELNDSPNAQEQSLEPGLHSPQIPLQRPI